MYIIAAVNRHGRAAGFCAARTLLGIYEHAVAHA
jgi:hypothetical protein